MNEEYDRSVEFQSDISFKLGTSFVHTTTPMSILEIPEVFVLIAPEQWFSTFF